MKKTAIEDFFSFSGLKYGDTIDQIFDLFGAPDDEYNNPDNRYVVFYYDMNDEFAINISFSSIDFKVESVFLGLHSKRAVKKLLEKFKIDEPKAAFIGNTVDEIYDYFGLPDQKRKNFIAYTEKNIEVEFYCPYDERSICRRIKVKWFY